MKQTPQKARPAKQPPTLDARAIFFERLTEAEEHAMQREHKAVDYLLEPAHKLLDYVPPEVLEGAADAIEYAIMGGEANGFCAGFYYALRMVKDMENLHAAAARYYEEEPPEADEQESGQA